MLKWLGSFAIVASAIVSVAYEQHYAREKYQAQSQADCIALAISPTEEHSCAKKAQNRKNYAPWRYELVTWPEGITTWAIILTGFAIAVQSWETRKAANAALLNAQAVINSERPWFIAEVVEVESGIFKIRITNKGKTPALLMWGTAKDSFESDPNMLHAPLTGNIQCPSQLLYTTDRYFDIPCNPGPGYNPLDLLRKPEADGKQLVLYGNVVYGDTFDKKARHETRWCLAYIKLGEVPKPTDFVLTGPDEYTGHT